MSEEQAIGSVRVSHRFSATAERVFDAWLDPAIASRWLFGVETGQNVRTDIDARVGGSFTVVDRREGVDVEHIGTYLQIDRPRRLVFEFQVPMYSAQRTRISIDIAALGDGCELTLVHEGVPQDTIVRTQNGWSQMLKRLQARLETAKQA